MIISKIRPTRTPVAVALALLIAGRVAAQQKQRYSSLPEALQSTAMLAGRSGPRGVEWIEGGRRFSFTVTNPSIEAL